MNHCFSNKVVMVPPDSFGYNESTFSSNAFQKKSDQLNSEEIRIKALEEFNNLKAALENAGVKVFCIPLNKPDSPDAVFPNNWFCSIPDMPLFIFPMMAVNRRSEKAQSSIEQIANLPSNSEGRIEDLSYFEDRKQFLEGTGSLVFDHQHKLAFAALSERTNPVLVDIFCERINYKVIKFHTRDLHGKSIYHTNVVLSVLKHQMIACLEVIPDTNDRQSIVSHAAESKRQLIEITARQMESFAGNVLQLCNTEGKLLLVMSEKAFNSFSPEQIKLLKEQQSLVVVNLDAIEHTGGGSARCMIAEIFNSNQNS